MQTVTNAHSRQKRAAVDEEAAGRLKRIMDRKYQTNKDNCGSKKAYELFLPGDVNFGECCYSSICIVSRFGLAVRA